MLFILIKEARYNLDMLPEKTCYMLELISDREGGMAKSELRDIYGKEEFNDRWLALKHAGYIKETGWVLPDSPNGLGYAPKLMITPAGRDYLAMIEKQAEEKAAEEHDKASQEALEDKRWRKDARREWIHWTGTTLLTIFSFFSGALVAVFTPFLDWFLSLWR